MWTSDVDLHSHSTHSDGSNPVHFVAEAMAAAGVRVWSLTDHDTTHGWEEAEAAAQATGMVHLPGVELTCTPALPPRSGATRSSSWHLLAYVPNGLQRPEVAALRAWIAGLTEARGPRMAAMVERLNALGVEVDLERVCARASGAVGRPHLAAELVDLGVVGTVQEAFDVWIGDGRPAHVERGRPSILEAASRVTSAGGFCSLAHPMYYDVDTDDLMQVLKRDGVDAVEAFHGSHDDRYRAEVWQAAVASGLSVTVGSDHHGPDHNPLPGRRPVPIDALHPAILALRNRAKAIQ